MFQSINAKQFKELISQDRENLEVIDVREKEEFDEIRVKNSKLISMGEVMDNLGEINWNKKVILICRSGSRSGYVAQLLAEIGKDVINMEGGIISLQSDNCNCLER